MYAQKYQNYRDALADLNSTVNFTINTSEIEIAIPLKE